MKTSYWNGKVAIVTGGSAGLGLVIVRTLLAAGCHTVIAARDSERLQGVVSQLPQAAGTAFPLACDVLQDADVERLIGATIERFGRLDLLVNNAGRSARGLALETPLADYQALWELNFLAAVRCSRLAAPHLVATQGHLVNIGSLAAKSASAYLGAYPTSKFPLAAFTQQVRLEMGKKGLHALLVCPGPIARTDAGRRYDHDTSNLPESAKRPGGGVKIEGLSPERIAERILLACERREPEIVLPPKARLLFAISQLSPRLGDWLVRRMTGN